MLNKDNTKVLYEHNSALWERHRFLVEGSMKILKPLSYNIGLFYNKIKPSPTYLSRKTARRALFSCNKMCLPEIKKLTKTHSLTEYLPFVYSN